VFEHQGIWLPDGEKHFPEWMDKNGEIVDGCGTYQIKKLREALSHVAAWRTAVDIGAHVGLWSMQLAKRFDNVIAFEPVAAFRECFAKNAWMRGVKCFPCALGAAPGMVSMHYDSADSGGTHVSGPGDIEMRTLDSFNLNGVDFLKVDCEGYELDVLMGAASTLLRCRPVVIVEQKQHIMTRNFGKRGTPAVDFLKVQGWATVREMAGDYIMVPYGAR